MWKKAGVIFWGALLLMGPALVCGASTASSGAVELARSGKEYSSARIEGARMEGTKGIAVVFEGTKDLHYYARSETAGAPGFQLKVRADSNDFEFGKAVFPRWTFFQDPAVGKVEVYVGSFQVFVPIEDVNTTGPVGEVEVTVSGQACTSMICLRHFTTTLKATIDYGQADSWKEISFEPRQEASEGGAGPSYSIWFALGLALLAGLSLNIMPCVWPVLPLIVMRIVEQAKQSRGRSMAMGLVFCLGILLFFACLAGLNIVLQVFYGTVLQWGDQFRNPVVVTFMALLMVVLALFMFGVFNVTVPSSIASKSGSGRGFAGSLGMGFLAAVLSTPCSFGILAAAFAWAQGQPMALGTLAIMVIGAGMALPYLILTSVPGLLGRMPRAGRWMELFKQTLGFVLLIIAVKMIKAVPDENRISVLYFAVVLSFCIWMWGSWVAYGTKFSRKLLIRGLAVVLALLAFGFFFSKERIEWQPYDAKKIETAKAEGRPVLIKFTADWCMNCVVVDRVVYQRKDIASLIEEKGVLAVKGDTTRQDQPATLALKNEYNEPGVPVTIVLLPGRDEPVRFQELFFADKLKELLESLPSGPK
ncbi:MAG TPA: thioredoxin family protein [Sedimentisphaerales bacterium]|nr:thioredoxin family protein [Sedimentisphaerales bacterium]